MRKNYWGFRIETQAEIREELFKELNNGKLRQGWGYKEEQQLPDTTDKGARKNLRMYREVKKGDILLIPRVSDWEEVAIVEATEDWDTGYEFKISEIKNKDGNKDFGHIFPAKFIESFNRRGSDVTANIRTSLKNRGRFWKMTHLSEEIENLQKNIQNNKEKISDEEKMKSIISYAFNKVFNEETKEEFLNLIYNK